MDMNRECELKTLVFPRLLSVAFQKRRENENYGIYVYL